MQGRLIVKSWQIGEIRSALLKNMGKNMVKKKKKKKTVIVFVSSLATSLIICCFPPPDLLLSRTSFPRPPLPFLPPSPTTSSYPHSLRLIFHVDVHGLVTPSIDSTPVHPSYKTDFIFIKILSVILFWILSEQFVQIWQKKKTPYNMHSKLIFCV